MFGGTKLFSLLIMNLMLQRFHLADSALAYFLKMSEISVIILISKLL